jgi:hypothetical protein
MESDHLCTCNSQRTAGIDADRTLDGVYTHMSKKIDTHEAMNGIWFFAKEGLLISTGRHVRTTCCQLSLALMEPIRA